MRESFCNREWALLEDNRQRGVYFASRGHFRLPDCEQLPSYREANQTDAGQCSHAELTTFRPDLVTTDCIRGRGRFYQGRVNVTKHGLGCQSWSSQTPHAHNRPPFVFPEIWNSENYCRNAGGEEPMPWCYTQDPFVRWQHCDIAACEEASTPTANRTLSMAGDDTPTRPLSFLDYRALVNLVRQPLSSVVHPQHPLALPLGAALITFLLTTVLLALVVSVRRLCFRRQLYTQTITSLAGIPSDFDLSKLPSNCAYHCTSATLSPKLESLEYPRNSIVYIRDIGAGAFGRVFVAKAPGLVPGEESTLVAVKVLREEANEEQQSDFEREASLMADFDHANVVRLLGVCALGRPMCLLVEYMAYGDLATFLRSLGPANYVVRLPAGTSQEVAFADLPKKMTNAELVNMTRQIASGMAYLASKHFVHRDLATRNCLVNADLVVKISDFGLSKQVTATNGNYYRADIEKDALPIRWMPLEAILYGRFTTASDVWSFGVLMWEVFTYALQPYYGLSHEQVIGYLKEGNRLTAPDRCPAPVYGLMSTCWQSEPAARPSFEALERSLEDVYFQLVKAESDSPVDALDTISESNCSSKHTDLSRL